MTIDRLISGAGAVAAGADDWARGFGGEAESRLLGRRPPAIAVAFVLFALAGLLLLVGIEATDPPAAPDLRAGALGQDDRLGQQTYVTVAGSLASTYLETYLDRNGNDVQDPDETGDAWYYWLVDPTDGRGITVRSDRPPSAIFTSRIRGVVTDDPAYVEEDVRHFRAETDALGLTLETHVFIDASEPAGGTAEPLDLGAAPPADGTLVEVSGSRIVDYLPVCPDDPNGDGTCQDAEAEGFDIIVYDPVGKRAITVFTPTSPAFSEATTLTGMLTRNERVVSDAGTAGATEFVNHRLQVNPHYVLDDGTAPPGSPVAFLLAAMLAVLGGVVLVGSMGGYLVFQRTPDVLPEPASTLGPGDRLPLRVTGFIRTPYGRLHVREAPADLVRFVLRPAIPATEPGVPETPAMTTLVVERTGYPQGVSLGIGELARLSAGVVTPFRGPRPALRVVAGTGPLLLSFDSSTDRDRVAAELRDETGMDANGRLPATDGPGPAPDGPGPAPDGPGPGSV